MTTRSSRSALVVSLHRGGFLRLKAAGLLQPAADPGVHCVSLALTLDSLRSLAALGRVPSMFLTVPSLRSLSSSAASHASPRAIAPSPLPRRPYRRVSSAAFAEPRNSSLPRRLPPTNQDCRLNCACAHLNQFPPGSLPLTRTAYEPRPRWGCSGPVAQTSTAATPQQTTRVARGAWHSNKCSRLRRGYATQPRGCIATCQPTKWTPNCKARLR